MRCGCKAGESVSLANASVFAGAVDGQSDETVKTTTDESGKFEFRTPASEFGVYVATDDGKWAGTAVSGEHDELLEITMNPTTDYTGRLVSRDGDTLGEHDVKAVTVVKGETRYDRNFVTQFDVPLGATSTGADGEFHLPGLPTGIKVIIRARPKSEEGEWNSVLELEMKAPQR